MASSRSATCASISVVPRSPAAVNPSISPRANSSSCATWSSTAAKRSPATPSSKMSGVTALRPSLAPSTSTSPRSARNSSAILNRPSSSLRCRGWATSSRPSGGSGKAVKKRGEQEREGLPPRRCSSVHHWSGTEHHPVAMTFFLERVQLGLLLGREDLIERGLRFCVRRGHLPDQVADLRRRLIDARRVIVLDRGRERLVRGAHVLVHLLPIVCRVGEDGSGLLLLCRRQAEYRRQEFDVV